MTPRSVASTAAKIAEIAEKTRRRYIPPYWCLGVLLMLVLFSAGCSVTVPHPAPVVPQHELSSTQMDRILARTYQYESMQALAQVRFRRGKERQSSTQALHVQSPYLLRAEVYNFMGRMVALLVADGAWMEAYVPSHDALYRGLATRARMERFAYVPLMPADMVALLLQRLPPGVIQLAEVEKGAGNSLIFTLPAQEDYVVCFTPTGVESIAYRQLGHEVFRLDYLDAKPTHVVTDGVTHADGMATFPRTMILSMHEQNLRLELKLEDLQLNPAIDPELFLLEPRSGTAVIPLEEI